MTSENARIDPLTLAANWAEVRHGAFEKLLALVRLKKRQGNTQKQIAERLGIDPATVSRSLKGNKNVTLRTLSDYARALNHRLEIDFTDLSTLSKPNECFALIHGIGSLIATPGLTMNVYRSPGESLGVLKETELPVVEVDDDIEHKSPPLKVEAVKLTERTRVDA